MRLRADCCWGADRADVRSPGISRFSPNLIDWLLAVDGPNSIELTAGVFCMLCANACAAAEFTFGLICCGPPAKTVDVCGVSISEILVYGIAVGGFTPQNGSPAYRAATMLPMFIAVSVFTIGWIFTHSDLVPVIIFCDCFRAGKEKGFVSAGWNVII